MRDRNIFLIVIALTCIAPFVERPVIAAEILIFAIVAVANNIMLGYTGMLSFGQATFFGFGASAAALLIVKLGLPLIVPIPAAVVFTTASAAVIGLFCVQRTGLYFLIFTFAFNQIFYFLASYRTTMPGGEDVLPGS